MNGTRSSTAPASESSTALVSLWLWALWFAMLAGLGQSVLVSAVRFAGTRITSFGRDFVWMALLGDAALFALVPLVLALAGRRVQRTSRVRVALPIFLFLLLIGPALLVPRVHPLAAVVLCAGIGIQAARVLRRRRGLVDATIRTTVWPLAIAGFAVGIAMHFSSGLAARLRPAPVAAAAGAPNVVLIVLDTVRAQNLSLYGYSRPTSPNLAEFARTGVTFERAFSASPWTLPSHGALFTGRFPHALSADWQTPLDATHPTLAELFARRGYATAGFVGNLLYCAAATGLNRGFSWFEDYPVGFKTLIASSWLIRPIYASVRRLDDDTNPLFDKRASEVNAEFEAWLASRPDRPFFAFLNYFDAHAPYRAPEPFNGTFGSGGPQPDLLVRRYWSKSEIQQSLDAYDEELAYLDFELGRLLETLKAQRLLDNTLVVVTSDHGEQFGDHGLFDHANSLYRQVLQVPLMMSFPGRLPANVRVPEPVSLVDVSATIVDLVATPGGERLPGRSLAEYWLAPTGPRPQSRPLLAEVSKAINMPAWLPASKGAMQSVIVDGMHYIRHSDDSEELYDLEGDAAEVNNLAARPEARPALDASRQALEALLSNR